jgi:hypothetical protein
VQGDLLSSTNCERPTKQRSGIWTVPKSSKFFPKRIPCMQSLLNTAHPKKTAKYVYPQHLTGASEETEAFPKTLQESFITGKKIATI